MADSTCHLPPQPHTNEVLEFSLSLVDPATLRLEAGDLEPGTKYKIHVAASTDVRDGFGLPLQSSSMSFATDGYPDRFMEPFETPSYFREFPHDWQARRVVGPRPPVGS